MAAAAGMFLHVPKWTVVGAVTLVALGIQIWGSYRFIRNVLRLLSLSLLAYVPSAFMAHPNIAAVLRGIFSPAIHFDRDTLAMVVAIIGTSLSAYIFTWQSNEEVEEKIASGRHTLRERRGTTERALKTSLWDVVFGMLFANVIMFFIMLATGSTLFAAGHHRIESATEAAQALRPLAGNMAGLLFSAGILGVGLLAIPVMTTGAAYDLCQTVGWAQRSESSTERRQALLWRDYTFHHSSDDAQLSRYQPHACTGTDRHHPGILHSSAAAADHDHYQSAIPYGRQGEWPGDQRRWMGYDCGYFRGLGVSGVQLPSPLGDRAIDFDRRCLVTWLECSGVFRLGQLLEIASQFMQGCWNIRPAQWLAVTRKNGSRCQCGQSANGSLGRIPVGREIRRRPVQLRMLRNGRFKKAFRFGRAKCVAYKKRRIFLAEEGSMTGGYAQGYGAPTTRVRHPL